MATRLLRSSLGWALVAIYLVVYVAAYLDALTKRGTFLGDIWLDILALPYIAIVGRFLLGSPTFEVHASEPLGLIPAVLFCGALLFLLGAGIQHGFRAVLGRLGSSRGKTETPPGG